MVVLILFKFLFLYFACMIIFVFFKESKNLFYWTGDIFLYKEVFIEDLYQEVVKCSWSVWLDQLYTGSDKNVEIKINVKSWVVWLEGVHFYSVLE